MDILPQVNVVNGTVGQVSVFGVFLFRGFIQFGEEAGILAQPHILRHGMDRFVADLQRHVEHVNIAGAHDGFAQGEFAVAAGPPGIAAHSFPVVHHDVSFADIIGFCKSRMITQYAERGDRLEGTSRRILSVDGAVNGPSVRVGIQALAGKRLRPCICWGRMWAN